VTRRALAVEGPPARRWSAALVLAGATLLTVQGGLLRIALPVIRVELDTGITGIQAVGLASLAAVTTTMVAFGRLADLLGARGVYAAGLAGWAAGGLAAAAVPTTAWLIVALIAQGLGWAMTLAAGTALLVQVFDPAERGRILAAQHSAIAVGLAVGPAAGGVVVDTLGWRWGFAGLAAAGLAFAALALARLPAPQRPPARPRFDLPGATLLALALVGLLVLAERGGAGALTRPVAAALVAAVAAAFAAFLVVELRTAAPVIDLRLFTRRGFAAGLTASFLNFIAMTGHMFLLPFALQDHLGHSAARAGALMIAAPAVILLTAPLAGVLTDRAGPRLPTTAGLALVATAVGLMATFDPATPLPWIIAVLTVYGLGAALFQSPNLTGVLGAAPAGQVGVASGTLATLGRLGQIAGITIAGIAWQAGLERHGDAALGPALRDTFLLLAAFGALGAVVSWLRGPTTVSTERRPARRVSPNQPPDH
jgi:MFS family permease